MTDHRTDQPAQADESPTGGDQTTEDQLEADQPAQADESPTGGDQTTEDQLEADNPVEEDMLKSLDPDAPPA